MATWQGSSVLVLHNPSTGTKTVDLAALGLDYTELTAVIGMDAGLEGTTLTLGGQTSVVLR